MKFSSDIAIVCLITHESHRLKKNKNNIVARQKIRAASLWASDEINFFTNNILTTKEKIPYKHLTDLTLRTATFSTTDIVFPLLIFLS